ncbi:hypothetical protein, partial [Mycolicibacterium insubricum]|uniref:hypothetical protein n=1 Tax=Mycolicibacterium insubricum TaxID=444597 RepID=UPI002AEF3454|nr:hypothetical protein [Mycolicibacterium insubricum]
MNINENPGATPAEGQPPATVATPDTDTDGDGGKPFEAITSQEALDKIIGKRLTREKATHTQALAAVQAQLDDATAKLASAGTAPAGDPDASVTQQIADLQARLDAEVAARACAEASRAARLPDRDQGL